MRRRLRLSYGCDCEGETNGRVGAKMTDGILSTVEEWTGSRPLTCPWRAFVDDLVREVLEAWTFFEKGALALFCPNPSHRLMMGLRCFAQAQNDIQSEQSRLDLEAAKKKAGK